MKILIFGATGGTGRHVVSGALAEGHDVVAYVRSPEKLGVEHERLEVRQGTLADAAALEDVMVGVDAVVSALGPVENRPSRELAQGMQRIIDAMKKQGVRRLVVATGAGVRAAQDRPRLLDRIIRGVLGLVARHILENSEKMIDVVRESKLDWVVLRGPRLVDKEGQGSFRLGFLGGDVGASLTRSDFAKALLAQVTQDTWLRQMPAVSN